MIYEATKTLDSGKGVLYLYDNYAGDNMDFDMAAEMAEADGIDVETVRVWDDIASGSPDEKTFMTLKQNLQVIKLDIYILYI